MLNKNSFSNLPALNTVPVLTQVLYTEGCFTFLFKER